MTDELVFRVIFSALWLIFIANLGWVRYSAWRSSSRVSPRGPAFDRTSRNESRVHLVVLSSFAPFWFGGIILYILLPDSIAFLSIPFPGWFRLVMAGAAAVGLPFTVWGYRTLGRNWVHAFELSTFQQREGEILVTSGPYAYVRNPIYLGAFTLIIALALEAANWLILLPTLVITTVICLQVGREEAMLIDRFGDEYREYMKRTPRFIPRFRQERQTRQR